jgi:hypothetical protein
MGWTNELENILHRYTTSGGAAAQPAPDIYEHYDRVAQSAPPSVLAEGLAAAFRSNQTASFEQMVATLFSHSNGEQKAGLLNHLLGSLSPGAMTQLASGSGFSALTSVLSGNKSRISPHEAEQISPEDVQQIATHAERSSPSIVDSVSSFYAQHSTLVKTLGGAALSVALAKVAERQRQHA